MFKFITRNTKDLKELKEQFEAYKNATSARLFFLENPAKFSVGTKVTLNKDITNTVYTIISRTKGSKPQGYLSSFYYWEYELIDKNFNKLAHVLESNLKLKVFKK